MSAELLVNSSQAKDMFMHLLTNKGFNTTRKKVNDVINFGMNGFFRLILRWSNLFPNWRSYSVHKDARNGEAEKQRACLNSKMGARGVFTPWNNMNVLRQKSFAHKIYD